MKDIWIKSEGILEYRDTKSCVLNVCDDIVKYYRSLVPKHIYLNKTKYSPHISVVREWEKPEIENWEKHSGEIIEFEYNPTIINDETYFWILARCDRIKEIRVELGLQPNATWHNGFHITLGNTK